MTFDVRGARQSAISEPSHNEAKVNLTDVGLFRVDLPATVKADAFDHFIYGFLMGELVCFARAPYPSLAQIAALALNVN